MQRFMKFSIKNYALCAFTAAVFITGCQKETTPIVIMPNDYFLATDKITEIMIHDIFSPPVASRIFAYPNVAAYEIIAGHNKKYNSLSGQLHGLTPNTRF